MTQFIFNPNDVIIRPFHPNDAPQQHGIVSDPRVAQIMARIR